jgi:hypothetical protein
MAQTPEGARKAKATLIAKYGEDYWSKMGKRGAEVYNAQSTLNRKPRGFAYMKATGQMDKIKAAGSLGGQRGRRKKAEDV